MKERKLLIADSSSDFREALARQLRECFTVCCCGSGVQALELLRTGQWDMLVLELLLPELDGVSLLTRLQREGICIPVVVVSRFITPYVESMCEPLGIGYLLRKPCSAEAAAERIRELGGCAALARPDPRTRTAEMLLRLRFVTKHDGFHYLREALPILLRSPHLSMTKELYPMIGAMFGRKGGAVERGIRSAIAAAWETRDRALWDRYFPGRSSRPSNAEFLFRMLEELRLEDAAGENRAV